MAGKGRPKSENPKSFQIGLKLDRSDWLAVKSLRSQGVNISELLRNAIRVASREVRPDIDWDSDIYK